MKRQYTLLKRQERIEAKRIRFESGQYNFMERTGLIVGLVFRPFIKLRRHMVLSTNKTLRESEIRRQQKKEHDAIKYKLDQDEFELSEIRIREESIKENRTRELELERLKKEKELEIERIKEATLKREFEENKAKIEAIVPEEVAQQELELERQNKKSEDKKRPRKAKAVEEKVEAEVEVSEQASDEPVVSAPVESEVPVMDENEPVKVKKPRSRKSKTEVVEPVIETKEASVEPLGTIPLQDEDK